MHAIVAGDDDEGIGDALEAEGVDVARLELESDHLTRPDLEDAGIVNADLYVLTDVSQATTIPIAVDLNDDLRTVAYTEDTMPEFVRGQLDLAVDPRLMAADVVAEELVD
ncbi:DUF7126 family protein [Natrialbaceae archaeon A-gly3]